MFFEQPAQVPVASTPAWGFEAGLYADLAMDDVPNLDEIGMLGTQRAYSRQRLEDETLCHLDKHNRQPTGWISTTSSLLRALRILFIEQREKGQLFVIHTRLRSFAIICPV